jgi:hypothetical protein
LKSRKRWAIRESLQQQIGNNIVIYLKRLRSGSDTAEMGFLFAFASSHRSLMAITHLRGKATARQASESE